MVDSAREVGPFVSGSDEPVIGDVVLELADVRKAIGEVSGLQRKLGGVVAFVGLASAVPLFVSTSREDFMRTAPFIFMMVLWGFFSALIPRAMAKRILGEKPEAERRMHYEFSPDGYTIRSGVSLGQNQWPAVHAFRELRSAYLLYLNPTVYQIVPKRAFCAQDLPRLSALFAARISKKMHSGAANRTLVLWLVLIAFFLVVWQFLEHSGTAPHR